MRVTQAKDGVDLEERADGLPATAYYRLAENWMVRPMAVGHARANSVFPRSRLPVFRLAVCVVLRVGDSYLLTKRVGGASFPYIWVRRFCVVTLHVLRVCIRGSVLGCTKECCPLEHSIFIFRP